VIWFTEFSKEALVEIAYKHYLNIYIDEERSKIERAKELRK
jgi:hypothetical protein